MSGSVIHQIVQHLAGQQQAQQPVAPPPPPVHHDVRVHQLMQQINGRVGEAHSYWAQHGNGRNKQEVARQYHLMMRKAHDPKSYGLKR
jgi:hypothetical protein